MHWARSEGDALAHRSRWLDSDDGGTRRPVRVGEGSYVFPIEVDGASGFADPDCRQLIRHIGSNVPTSAPMAIAPAGLGPSCVIELAVGVAVLGVHRGPHYFLFVDPAEWIPWDEQRTGMMVLVGEEVGAEAFPAVPLATE